MNLVRLYRSINKASFTRQDTNSRHYFAPCNSAGYEISQYVNLSYIPRTNCSHLRYVYLWCVPDLFDKKILRFFTQNLAKRYCWIIIFPKYWNLLLLFNVRFIINEPNQTNQFSKIYENVLPIMWVRNQDFWHLSEELSVVMFYLLEQIKTAYYSGEFPFAKMYRRVKFGTLSFREKGSLDLNIYNGPPFQNHKNLIPETKTFLAYYKASTLNKYYKWLKSCEILWKHEIASHKYCTERVVDFFKKLSHIKNYRGWL